MTSPRRRKIKARRLYDSQVRRGCPYLSRAARRLIAEIFYCMIAEARAYPLKFVTYENSMLAKERRSLLDAIEQLVMPMAPEVEFVPSDSGYITGPIITKFAID